MILYIYKLDNHLQHIKNGSVIQSLLIYESLGREGIGYKSDHKSFDNLVGQKSVPAILHTTGL